MNKEFKDLQKENDRIRREMKGGLKSK